MIGHTYLSNADVDAIDDLYLQYQNDPDSVDFGWKKFFEGFDLAYNKTGNSIYIPLLNYVNGTSIYYTLHKLKSALLQISYVQKRTQVKHSKYILLLFFSTFVHFIH